jgi:hypothetical protein
VPSSLGLGFGLVLDLGLGLGLALGLLVGFFAGLRLGMIGLQHWNGLSDLRYFRGAKGDYLRSLQCNCRLTGLDLAVS